MVALRADLDLALVQIPLGHGHTPLPMATRGEDLAPNALLAHGGHPLGLEWAFTLGDYLGTVPDAGHRVRLRFAGSVHPGDSGGPLVCEAGQVHGVVVTRHASRAEGYAVPVEYLREMLQALRAPPTPSAPPTPPVPPATRHPAAPAPGPSPVQVTVYGAPWCGACRAATAWLGRQGIAHQERDASELGDPESIPVIVVQGPRGRVTLQGFSPASLTQALGQVR